MTKIRMSDLEIGSEFYLNYSSNEEQTKSNKSYFKYISTRFLMTGRASIAFALADANNKVKSKIAYLPAYICESVIDCFTYCGYKVLFYDIDKSSLAIKEIDIKILNESGIFFYCDYFGLSQNKQIPMYLKKAKSNNVLLIKDITHSLFNKNNDEIEADYYVASLHKWMGLPSGGCVFSNNTLINPPLEKNNDYIDLRKSCLYKKGEYIMSSDPLKKKQYLDEYHNAEMKIKNDFNLCGMDELSKALFLSTNFDDLIKIRIDNFNYLYNNLKFNHNISPIFAEITDGSCPLFFPIYIKNNRTNIRKILIKNEIYCPIHWQAPQTVDLSKYPESKFVYDHILSIPCDQRYTKVDMERIVHLFNDIDYGSDY